MAPRVHWTGTALSPPSLQVGARVWTLPRTAGALALLTDIPEPGAGSGDVVGPASATDLAVARFDGTTGKLVQSSSLTVSDLGAITSGSWAATAIPVAYLGSGTPSAGMYLDGAGTWTTLPAGGGLSQAQVLTRTAFGGF